MPYMIPIDPGFEPGPTTKTLLYYVNKKNSQIGTTPQPGLIQDTHFTVMAMFFLIAIVLEVVGLMFIINAIALGFWSGLMSVSFLVSLDILFAFLFHLKTKTICHCENKLVVLPLIAVGKIAASRADLESKINKAKWYGYFIAILIWGVAVTKMVAFYALSAVGAGGVDTQAMFIIVTYIIVALIHIKCTGYAFFGFCARISWWLNEKEYIKSKNQQPQEPVNPELTAQERHEYIVTPLPIPAQINIGLHVLEKLVQVDLVTQDQAGCGRVVLEKSILQDVTKIKKNAAETEIMQEKNVPRNALYPEYQAEIDQKIADMLKVPINKNEPRKGVLATSLITYLTSVLAVRSETPNDPNTADDPETKEDSKNLSKLAVGQSLYRLKTVGLLFDHELVAMAGKTPDTASQNEIALHGLRLQLQML